MRKSVLMVFIFFLVLDVLAPCLSPASVPVKINSPSIQTEKTLSLLTDELRLKLQERLYDDETRQLYIRILSSIAKEPLIDTLVTSNAYYYAAFYNQSQPINNIDSAIILYREAMLLREKIMLKDDTYAKICYNLGKIYIDIGDPFSSIQFGEEGLRVRQELEGKESLGTISLLQNLAAAYISASYWDQAIETALQGIKIIKEDQGYSNILNNIKFHLNAGNSYKGLKNYSIAEDYLNVAYNLFIQNNASDTNLLLSILTTLASTAISAGEPEKSIGYYKMAVAAIKERDYYNSVISITTFNNYGYLLADQGQLDEAASFIEKALEMAMETFGPGSFGYNSQKEFYAYFLSTYSVDLERGLAIYDKLDQYIDMNPWNREFRSTVNYGFAMALQLDGNFYEALEKLEVILADSIYTSEKSRLNSLLLKRTVLYKMYLEEGSIDFLKESFEAIRLAVDIYDRIRQNISTTESMLKAGSRYNFIYDECISTLYHLFHETGDPVYSELCFIYSEKAKAASLLASTRQSRAMKFHIPVELSEMEINLEKEINAISELLFIERSKQNPDPVLVAGYDQMKLQAIMRNDSLKQVFEKDYPRYNAIKNNTSVSGYEDIKNSIGRNRNFIEYYAADTILYIYLINSNTFEMHAVSYTPELQQDIRALRHIITNPAIESGAVKQYIQYTKLAYSLYKSVFSPVKESLVSERLIIAPDNLLSYIPFETFLTSEVSDSSVNYRRLPFLVNSYDIVYAYSGTLLTESSRGGRSLRNRAITFAPDYKGDIYVDSIMVTRQPGGDVLKNIPGAREEAISVNRILGGKLFLDSESTETRFKENAAGSRIIHMAMHTLLNDVDPMYSKMVFTMNDDGPNDGKLNTYEVYDVPLDAKMVVLSSCNTGSGYLQTGEGIMSLARGFFYSGSPTVVMSLWEVDDRSGSQIITRFYENLKHGKTKSNALRKARVSYLRNADQMRSHPYFWCTLVIMGDDTALFYPGFILIISLLVIAGLAGWILFRYRFRSS